LNSLLDNIFFTTNQGQDARRWSNAGAIAEAGRNTKGDKKSFIVASEVQTFYSLFSLVAAAIQPTTGRFT